MHSVGSVKSANFPLQMHFEKSLCVYVNWLAFCVCGLCVCGRMLVQDKPSFLCSTLTQRSVTQPCVGQVLGDSFAEIESLGMPEHFCEDELLFILNSDKR